MTRGLREPLGTSRLRQVIAIISSASVVGGLGFGASVLLPVIVMIALQGAIGAQTSIDVAALSFNLTLILALHFISIANLRFVLRLLPLAESGRRRAVIVTFFTACLLLGGLGMVWTVREPKSWTLFLVVRPILLLCSATCGRVFWRHLRGPALLERPFILFLRPFASFSDRSLLISVLQAAPRAVPVVMIGGPLRDMAAWDPFLLGFSGMKAWRAFASSPVFFRSLDATWENVVARLASKAECVLLDSTQLTRSLHIELEMLHRLPPERVVLVRDSASGLPAPADPWSTSVRVVTYRKGWFASLPRIALGLSLSVLVPVAVVVALRGKALVNVLGPDLFADLRDGLGRPLYWIASPLIAPLFLRKTVKRGFKRELSEFFSRIGRNRVLDSN